MSTPREVDVESLMLVIAELVDRYETSERHTWRPTRQTPGYDRKVRGRDGKPRWEKPLPKTAQRRVHRTREPGLLEQLRRGPGRRRAVSKPPGFGYDPGLGYQQTVDATALVTDMAPTPGRSDVGGGHTKPTSTPPAGLDAIETLIDITVAIAHTRGRLRMACGRGRGRVEPAPVMLRDLADMVVRKDGDGQWLVPDRQVRRLLGEARSWASTARLALRYDAPVVVLKDRHCADGPGGRGCGGQLKVRADASSDVWCAGIPGRVREGPALEGEPWPIPDRGCGARWTRVTWIDLLDQGQEAG
jgi:hypothetical protein